jgi:hypothetical protein
MGRWQVLAIVVAPALLAALPAVAQGGYATRPDMPEITGDAAQLYEDVQLLITIRALDLSAAQMGTLAQISAGVLSEQRDLAELRARMWDQYEDEIEDVLDAWMAGESPSSRDRSAADRAVNRVNDAQADLQKARWEAAESLYDALSEAQRDRVEGPAAAEERSARTQRMGGTESVGQYMVAQFDAIRDLMPDEFEMLGASEAYRIAQAIVGPNANTLPRVSDRVLDWLLEVYAWTPDQYRAARSDLPARVERDLGITPTAERGEIEWTELVSLVSSDRTPVVIAEIVPARGGEVE